MGIDIRTRIDWDLLTHGETAMLTETQTGERTSMEEATAQRPGLITMFTDTDSDIGVDSSLPSTVEAEPCAIDWSSVLPRRAASRARRNNKG